MWDFLNSLFGFHESDLADVFRHVSTSGDAGPQHRRSGSRARRKWKRTRAAGITKRVRS